MGFDSYFEIKDTGVHFSNLRERRGKFVKSGSNLKESLQIQIVSLNLVLIY